MPVESTHKKLLINSTCIFMLSLLFMVSAFPLTAAPRKHKNKVKGVVRPMTVIAVEPPNNNETYISVIFQISQRRYKLPKDANPAYIKLLKESARNHTPVLIERAKEESDIIMSVKKGK